MNPNQQVENIHRFEALPCMCRQCGRQFGGQLSTLNHGRDTGSTRVVAGQHVEIRTTQLCFVCTALAPYRDTPKALFRGGLVHRAFLEAMANELRRCDDEASRLEAAHAERILASAEPIWTLWDRVIGHPSASFVSVYLARIEANLIGINPAATVQLGPIACNKGAYQSPGQAWMASAVEILERGEWGEVDFETSRANDQVLASKDGLIKAVIRGKVDPTTRRAATMRAFVAFWPGSTTTTYADFSMESVHPIHAPVSSFDADMSARLAATGGARRA
jgi:hypothetical protein